MTMEQDTLSMSESWAALDAVTRRKMEEELLQFWHVTHFTALFVTHSIPEAVLVGNRILLLSPHPGQVKAELNSKGRAEGGEGRELSQRIQRMLFAEEVEEEAAAHA